MKLTKLRCLLLSGFIAAAQAETMRVNGVAVEMQQFTVPVAELHRLDTGQWSLGVGTVRPGQFVLSRQRGPRHEVLTLRPISGTGRIAVLATSVDLSKSSAPIRLTPIPLPAGSRLTAVVEPLRQPGSTTYTGYWPGTASSLQAYFVSQAQQRRWQSLPTEVLPQDGASLRWWSRGKELLALSLVRLPVGCRFILLHETGAAKSSRQSPVESRP